MQCRKAPVLVHTDGVFPLHQYRFWYKTLLHVWKAEDCRSLSPVFAKLMYKALRELSEKCGVTDCLPVVPVPPRPDKIRKRGWDQIAELTAVLKKQYDVPILPLLRRLSVAQQKKLDRQKRLETAKHAYVFDEKAFLRACRTQTLPPAVVLVDDVLTTGATIESCACALKEAGVQTVYAITLFVVE